MKRNHVPRRHADFYRLCGHCNRRLIYSTYKYHEANFYDRANKTWKTNTRDTRQSGISSSSSYTSDTSSSSSESEEDIASMYFLLHSYESWKHTLTDTRLSNCCYRLDLINHTVFNIIKHWYSNFVHSSASAVESIIQKFILPVLYHINHMTLNTIHLKSGDLQTRRNGVGWNWKLQV